MVNGASAETHMARYFYGQTFLILLTLPFFHGCTVPLNHHPKRDAATGELPSGPQRDLNLTSDLNDSGFGLNDSGFGLNDSVSDAQSSDVSVVPSAPVDMDPLRDPDSTTPVTDPELSIESSDGGLVDAELSEVGAHDLPDHGANDALLAPDQNSSTDDCGLVDECVGNCLAPTLDPCADVDCGLGYCRDGACICPYGHGGEACSECENGWVPDTEYPCRPMIVHLFDDTPNTFDSNGQIDELIRGFGDNDIFHSSRGNDLCDGGDGDDELFGEWAVTFCWVGTATTA